METEHLKEAARLIRLLADRLPAHREAAESWLAENTRLLTRPVAASTVFDPCWAAGYVWAGQGGEARPRPHPGLAGIDDAHVIFLAGPTAQHTHCAESLGCSPNALRNRLDAAARWAEGEALPQLARCIGAISVAVDGALSYTRPADVELQLRMPA